MGEWGPFAGLESTSEDATQEGSDDEDIGSYTLIDVTASCFVTLLAAAGGDVEGAGELASEVSEAVNGGEGLESVCSRVLALLFPEDQESTPSLVDYPSEVASLLSDFLGWFVLAGSILLLVGLLSLPAPLARSFWSAEGPDWYHRRGMVGAVGLLGLLVALTALPFGLGLTPASSLADVDLSSTLFALFTWVALGASLIWLSLTVHWKNPRLALRELDSGEDDAESLTAALQGSLRSLAAQDDGGIDLIETPPEVDESVVPDELLALGGEKGILSAAASLLNRMLRNAPYVVQGSWHVERGDLAGLELTLRRGSRFISSEVFRLSEFGFGLNPRDRVLDPPARTAVAATVASSWLLNEVQADFLGRRLTFFGSTSWRSAALVSAGVLWQRVDHKIARSLYADALALDGSNLGASFNLARTHMLDNQLIEALDLLQDLPRYRCIPGNGDVLSDCHAGAGLDFPTVLKATYNYAASYLHAVELDRGFDPNGELKPCEPLLPGQIPDSADSLMSIRNSYSIAICDAQRFVDSSDDSEGARYLRDAVRSILPQFKEIIGLLADVEEPATPGFRTSDKGHHNGRATGRQAYNHAARLLTEIEAADSWDDLEHRRLWRQVVNYLSYATRDPAIRAWAANDPSLRLLRTQEFSECQEGALGLGTAPEEEPVKLAGEVRVRHAFGMIP